MRITMHHKQLAQENHNFSGNTWHSDSRGYEYKHILTSTAKIVLVTKIWCGIYINQIWYIKMNHQSTKVRTNSLNGVQWRGPQLEIIIDKTRYWMWSTAYDWCYHGNGNRSTHLRFTAVIIVLWKADVPTIQLTTTWPKSLYSHSTDNIKDKNNTASHRMSDTWCKQYTDIKQVNWHHSGPKLYDWPWQGCCRHQASQFMSLLSICSLPLKMAIFLHLLPHHHDYYYLERVPLMTLSRCCA